MPLPPIILAGGLATWVAGKAVGWTARKLGDSVVEEANKSLSECDLYIEEKVRNIERERISLLTRLSNYYLITCQALGRNQDNPILENHVEMPESLRLSLDKLKNTTLGYYPISSTIYAGSPSGASMASSGYLLRNGHPVLGVILAGLTELADGARYRIQCQYYREEANKIIALKKEHAKSILSSIKKDVDEYDKDWNGIVAKILKDPKRTLEQENMVMMWSKEISMMAAKHLAA